VITFKQPLDWPSNVPFNWDPRESRFGDHALSEAIDFVAAELERFGADRAEMSADWQLGQRGQPLTDHRNGGPVVLRYWRNNNPEPFIIALCEYNRTVDNIWAIGKCVEALRTMERHGGDAITRQAESAFAALPEPEKQWWQVLECAEDDDPIIVHAKYKVLAKKHHPDNSGSHDSMATISNAYDQFKKMQGVELK
jgi:hypothetical protein